MALPDFWQRSNERRALAGLARNDSGGMGVVPLPDGDPPLLSQARGMWGGTATLAFAGESHRLRVGRLERHVLPLGDGALCQGRLPPGSLGEQLWEAGGVLSGALEELMATVCATGSCFAPRCTRSLTR